MSDGVHDQKRILLLQLTLVGNVHAFPIDVVMTWPKSTAQLVGNEADPIHPLGLVFQWYVDNESREVHHFFVCTALNNTHLGS